MTTRIEQLALNRMHTIIESWWHEDLGDFQEQYNLTNEEVEQVIASAHKIKLVLA